MRPDGVAASLSRLGESALDAADALSAGAGDVIAGANEAVPTAVQRKDTRAGLKTISFFTTPEAWRQLHHTSIDADQTVEALMNEALNMLFRARGLPEIAPVRRPADSAGQAEPAGDNPT